MARALWKGSLSFGLVSIPIELHTAVRNHRPRFRMLHARDKSPVRFERVCVRDGQPVAWEDLIKGYEYEKGHFVVLTKEDFQAAAVEKTRTVDILDFVNQEEIDDRFFETPYYLVPAKGGERAYAILRDAIRNSWRRAERGRCADAHARVGRRPSRAVRRRTAPPRRDLQTGAPKAQRESP